MDTSAITFDACLIERYDSSSPRYTSYPTAAQFGPLGVNEYKAQAAGSLPYNPLSLYFHIPFCDKLCYYCGCNKIVTKDRSRAQPYLLHLYKEMDLQSELFEEDRPIKQLHWGGGTPTFISNEQIRELMHVTREYFNLLNHDAGEYSIEIDPRSIDHDTLHTLRDVGFNRLSFGVQDFNPIVQKAVHRIQSEEQMIDVMSESRRLGFKSINIDLIYGLPFQTVITFNETLKKIIALSPDRLSIFNYAHMPLLFPAQKRINHHDLPLPHEKLAILKMTIDTLIQAGYVYIGMDHFAKPDDELALAQKNNTLHRNFQGYSAHADCDLIGLGVSSISKINNGYMQNAKTVNQYYELLDQRQLPVVQGIILNQEDQLRSAVINALICYFYVDKALINANYSIEFDQHFSDEQQPLAVMQKDGLVELTPDAIVVTPRGKLLVRHICKVFDQYSLMQSAQRFSKVI